MTNLTPMLSELHRIFDALNEEYFNNELPNVFITITPGTKKNSSVYGTFTPDTWFKTNLPKQIEGLTDLAQAVHK